MVYTEDGPFWCWLCHNCTEQQRRHYVVCYLRRLLFARRKAHQKSSTPVMRLFLNSAFSSWRICLETSCGCIQCHSTVFFIKTRDTWKYLNTLQCSPQCFCVAMQQLPDIPITSVQFTSPAISHIRLAWNWSTIVEKNIKTILSYLFNLYFIVTI